ncbi:MAG: hypothetical protein RLZZ623_777 [Actinomycetota bacterium]
MIDHVVLATDNLERTVTSLRTRLGVVPVPGGSHVGMGTRNELLGLGGGAYLEVVGPDHGQPTPTAPRPFGIDDIAGEAIVAWCARPARSLETVVHDLSVAGHQAGPISAMSRRRPDGLLLSWRLTFPQPHAPLGSVMPFLIDWGSSDHPATTLPADVGLQRLILGTPHPSELGAMLAAVGADERIVVVPDDLATLTARFTTPLGRVTLPS